MSARKTYGLTALVLLLVVGCVGVVFYVSGAKQKQQQVAIYHTLQDVIGDFHGDMKTLNASVESREELQDQVRIMKERSDSSREKLRQLEARVHALKVSPNALYLQEAVEKTDKYLGSFEELSHLAVTIEKVSASSEAMLTNLNNYRTEAAVFGSVDEGDTQAAIDKANKLVTNFKKSLNAKPAQAALVAMPAPVTVTRVVVESDGSGEVDWSPYTAYKSQIRSIVARYSNGRKTLAEIVEAYDDNGALSTSQSSSWFNQLSLRRGLIAELNGMDIPPTNMMRQHHQKLLNMLVDACDSMEWFGKTPNSTTRDNLHNVSDRNGTIMNGLKDFYGID